MLPITMQSLSAVDPKNHLGMSESRKHTEQALDQNPMSLKAQPILMLFERVARLRSNPQFSPPA
jgi:hypothetical protein